MLLQDLFKYRSNTLCETHDLLGCKCCITSVETEEGVRAIASPFHSSRAPIISCLLSLKDDFIDDDDADQIEPGYIVRRVRKKDFSGEELEGWDHYPSSEYVQVEAASDPAPPCI